MTFAQRAESAWSKSFLEMEKLCKKLFQNVKNCFAMEAFMFVFVLLCFEYYVHGVLMVSASRPQLIAIGVFSLCVF